MNAILRCSFIYLLALLLIITPALSSLNVVNASSMENDAEITLKIALQDGLFTKSKRITFDLFARTLADEKLDYTHVQVTNNGKDVAINWDDEVKTSYTVLLEQGLNEIEVIVTYNDRQYIRNYTITYEEAEEGEKIGEFTFSMDGFVVGLDYFIDPILVDIVNGENGAHHLERVLYDNGFESSMSGSTDGGYYLETIYEGNLLDKPDLDSGLEIPTAIIDALDERGYSPYDNWYTPADYGLGEFDFNSMSGWMYSVNNVFPNVGFSDYYLIDQDIMRVQYTVAYGDDIGGGYASGASEYDQFFTPVDKDYLTEAMAHINSSVAKDELLNINHVKQAYDHAFETIRTVDISQIELDAAEQQLEAAYDAVKLDALASVIDTLPTVESITLNEKERIEDVRKTLNRLTREEQEQIINYETFLNLEQRLSLLQLDDVTLVNTILDLIAEINNLSSTELTLDDKTYVQGLREIYEGIEAQYRYYVTNSNLLALANETITQLEMIEVAKAEAKQFIEQYGVILNKQGVELTDEYSVQEVTSAYEALSALTKQDLGESIKEQIDSLLAGLNQLKATVEDVATVIEALPEKAEIKLSDESELLDARALYNALPSELQQQISNIQKLNDLEEQVTSFKTEIEQITQIIDRLPAINKVTAEDEVAIKAARTAYDSLSSGIDVPIAAYDKLVKLEDELGLLIGSYTESAKPVETAIKNLPEVDLLTSADIGLVNATVAKYELLDEISKPYVTNYDKLKQLQKKASQLVFEGIEKVEGLISALPQVSKITLKDQMAIKSAREAYDNLPANAKVAIANLTTLEVAEKQLEKLFEGISKVESLINALPQVSKVVVTDENRIKATREAYNKLSEDEKPAITNYQTLVELEKKLTELLKGKDETAEKVKTTIAKLPELSELKTTNKSAITAARTAYNKLTDEQKKAVSNFDKLEKLEAKLVELEGEQKKAQTVITQIKALPSVTVLAIKDKEKIVAARTAYSALTDAQKKLVTNLTTLEQLEKKFIVLQEANNVASKIVEQIATLPSLTAVKETDKPAIEAAIKAYSQLTADQKKLVTNYSTLTRLKTKLDSLTKEETDKELEQTKDWLKVTAKAGESAVEVQASELLTQLKKGSTKSLLLTNDEGISVSLTTQSLITNLTSKGKLVVDSSFKNEHGQQVLNINFAQQLSSTLKSSLSLKNEYATITFPLTKFTRNKGASISNDYLAATNDGVILRLEDGEYKAVPHRIVNGNVEIYANGGGQFVYSTEKITFNDIKKMPNANDIEFLADRHIVTGTSATKYSPEANITRAQFGAMIARALNLQATEETYYTDTKGKWYEGEIQALYEAGITESPGKFNPGAPLTRQHAAAFMYRVMEYTGYEADTLSSKLAYRDSLDISKEFKEAIMVLKELGIMEGDVNNTFQPKAYLTRGQMAKILKRTLTTVEFM